MNPSAVAENPPYLMSLEQVQKAHTVPSQQQDLAGFMFPECSSAWTLTVKHDEKGCGLILELRKTPQCPITLLGRSRAPLPSSLLSNACSVSTWAVGLMDEAMSHLC